MSEQWITCRLRDVLDPIAIRAADRDIELVLSVTEKRGIIPQSEVFRKRIATKDVSKYKVLEPLDIAYNPYLLWTGAIGQWMGEVPGLTSPVYECFRARENVNPRFLGLLLASGMLTPYFDSTAIGSIQRRRRTTPKAFLDAVISMPPLQVQHRVVDFMSHLSRHLTNLQAERFALASVLDGLLKSWDENLVSIATINLGDRFLVRSGASWSAKEESKVETKGSLRVVKITNTRSDGRLDLSEETYVRGLSDSQGVLSERSLIVIRTNGSRDRIGNVYRASPESYGSAVSAFQFSVEAPTSLDRDWLYWWLRVPARQRFMSEVASGSTGLGNLASTRLKGMTVPWPDQSEKQSQIELFSSVDEQLATLATEIRRLGKLENSTLSTLLNGVLEISDEYDILFPEGA